MRGAGRRWWLCRDYPLKTDNQMSSDQPKFKMKLKEINYGFKSNVGLGNADTILYLLLLVGIKRLFQ